MLKIRFEDYELLDYIAGDRASSFPSSFYILAATF